MTRKNLVRRTALFGLLAVTLTFFPSGCGSDVVTGTDITLSGTLDGARERAPLAGFKVKCVAFTTSPSSGTATADAAGKFSVNFAGGGVPFGCFVLNTSDAQVASMFFNSSTSGTTGQTIKITATTDLGTVTVDTTRGTATVATTAAASDVTTGIGCPLGVWKGTVGVNNVCTGNTENATLWLGKDSAGAFVLSQALNPHNTTGAPASCGLSAFAPTGTTAYDTSNYILTWSFNMGAATSAEAEVSQDCRQMSVTFTQTGCNSCGPTADLAALCTGTGTTTCTSNVFVFYRQ